jgi:phosphatidate cytidylyltransferase
MVKRSITGVFFLLVMISAIIYNPISLMLLFLLLTIAGVIEFNKIAAKSGIKIPSFSSLTTGILTYLILTAYFLFQLSKWLPLLVLFPTIILITELFRKSNQPLQSIAVSIFPAIYISMPFSILCYFANFENEYMFGKYDFWLVLGFFILIWTNDTGAYLSGTFFGKKQLFPRHSPKKTWEGFIGGLVLALIAGFFLSELSDIVSLYSWLVIALIISVCGTFGDLAESMFKRKAGVKDSGNLMPGHGGVLDRFDAVFTSAPLVWVYLSLIC